MEQGHGRGMDCTIVLRFSVSAARKDDVHDVLRLGLSCLLFSFFPESVFSFCANCLPGRRDVGKLLRERKKTSHLRVMQAAGWHHGSIVAASLAISAMANNVSEKLFEVFFVNSQHTGRRYISGEGVFGLGRMRYHGYLESGARGLGHAALRAGKGSRHPGTRPQCKTNAHYYFLHISSAKPYGFVGSALGSGPAER